MGRMYLLVFHAAFYRSNFWSTLLHTYRGKCPTISNASSYVIHFKITTSFPPLVLSVYRFLILKMTWQTNHQKWKRFTDLDKELHKQLTEMVNDVKQLEDSFYKNPEFGTGGMRGELGPGTNRMNIYTIRKTVEGLARYVAERGETSLMLELNPERVDMSKAVREYADQPNLYGKSTISLGSLSESGVLWRCDTCY